MKTIKNLYKLSIVAIVIMLFNNCNSARINGDENDLLKKAYNLVVLKDYISAIQTFTKVLDTEPDNVEAYVYRGMCKYYIGDFVGSITDYDTALKIQPNYAEAYNLRGIAKGEMKDKIGACDDWHKAFEYGYKNSFELIKEFCIDN